MTTVKEITDCIEAFAPLSLQQSWDNCALQVGSDRQKVHGALLTLDASEQAIKQASILGVGLVISHHPLIFDPLKSITEQSSLGRTILLAAREGISIYSSHTATDSAVGGINCWLASRLALTQVEPLGDMGRVGLLNSEMSMGQFNNFLKEIFDIPYVRHSLPCGPTIRKVALCGGSGGSFLEQAVDLGADALVTGDVKHNVMVEALGRITVFDVGHYESEKQFMEIMAQKIREKFPTFVLHYFNSNPVEID
ncbi:MAG: Nif3-like dinuclear metal center hexameric protein [Mucinivorans sp.]